MWSIDDQRVVQYVISLHPNGTALTDLVGRPCG